MVPVPSYQNLPTFGGGATLVQPIAGTYNGGFLPGQLFPAEYENWLMNFITANSNTSQTSVLSMNAELVNILTAASLTPIPATNTQVKQALDLLYLAIGAQAEDSAKLGGVVAANYALLASPTFSGTVIVPVASGGTSPTQKTYVDSQVSANSLTTVQSVSGSLNSGPVTDTVSSMAVGELRMFNFQYQNSSGSNKNYIVNLPASGTYTWSLFYLSATTSANNAFGSSASSAQAGGSNILTVSVQGPTPADTFFGIIIIKRTA